ncbi:ATPase [Chamaesiphon polymorphus CCALA 037]|uniref:histidine kinase n=2 Tax=Chamaesiphon TaxID=217161 RepID=A0A2T1GL15_9CYAN|nr:ATPase [Chamaesiphon polymorphus CCALA 037]
MISHSYPSLNSPASPPFELDCPELEQLMAIGYRSGDLGAYLMEIVRGVSRIVRSDWTIVTMCSGEIGRIMASSLDLERDNAGFLLHGTLAADVIQSGRSFVIEDCRQDLCCDRLSNSYLSYLGIPLSTTNGAVIGTICSFFQVPRLFAESEIKIVELFAERAATAIENYLLYQQQQQFNEILSQQVAARTIELQLAQEQLIESERLAAIGEFTATIVHEVRNPLTTIEMGLQYAWKVLDTDADRQRLDLALSESQRLKHLLQEILSYAKPQILQLTRLHIGNFINDLLLQVRDLPETIDRQIDYVSRCPEIEVMADIDKLKQVFLNLFRNACEAIEPNETVSCQILPQPDFDRVCIQIHNGGNPIPPASLHLLTTPFYSTKPAGTGLGLAISQRIIIAHGGELAIVSSDSGTTVNVLLPIFSA